jgi:glycosyltransferase involved in cell wall biosynthesis
MDQPAEPEQTAPRKSPAPEPRAGPSAIPPGTPPVLTVVVPVYNEVQTIDELLRRVLAASYSKEVIVVDDGSTDGTAKALEAWADRPGVRLLVHTTNQGKGAAIRTALEHARGRFTIIQDADLECDPEDYPVLIEPLLSGEAEVVYGSRYLRRQDRARHRWCLLRWGVSVINAWVRLLYGVRLTDEATCYKVLPTAVLRKMDLQCRGFEFCPEVTAKLCRLGLRIDEVPIRYFPRAARAGKKLRWRDGLKAAATLWKYRRWSANTSDDSDALSSDES